MRSNEERRPGVEARTAQMIQFAAGGRTASTIARARPRRMAAGQQLARNPFGLTLAEVRAEVRRCLARGWQLWEIRRRFTPDDREGR